MIIRYTTTIYPHKGDRKNIINHTMHLEDRVVYTESTRSEWESKTKEESHSSQRGYTFVFDRGIRYNLKHDIVPELITAMNEHPDVDVHTLLSWIKL